MKKELAKNYSPKEFEDRIYQKWEKNGYFRAKIDKNKKPYTIMMPPPNITGQLHMGHALNNSLQDLFIRYKRMQGYAALWLPGTDHASIATEARIVNAMKEEGLTKDDVGRDGFLERAWKWRERYGGRIVQQLKKLGSSCDWERERFTLDEGCSKAVQTVFIDLYNKGLIYHGKRMINWCPECRTSISDIECEYEEQDGHFWHIRYPFKDGSGALILATTRPETLLGDTAVAVNPKDERYQHLIGKMLILPLCDREIPIIADEYVDMEFGTGVVKITPAHDPNDYEVGLRHNLPIINVMDENAVINENGGKYQGLYRFEARKQIVKDLEAGNYLVKIENHTHNVGCCQRCGTVVEPALSLQWFVSMKKLAQPAIDVVKSGELKYVPKHFENSYLHWMENIRDWCISRQLWWGHRIPVYYCQNSDCKHEIVSSEPPHACPKCGCETIVQDEDTLDTWFSSALWPFSTLGWPDKTEDFEYFYPTNTLITAYDIIGFWVARMIFMGLEFTGQKPFEHVLINGIVRDEQGRKMSKSLGNGVDPLEMIDLYGADALRMMLLTGNAPGNDIRWSESRITASRNFINKLWNASRYILMNLPDDFTFTSLPETLCVEDKWIVSQLNQLNADVTANLDAFDAGVALQNISDFFWDVYCDWYIELTKPRIAAGGEGAHTAQSVLVYVIQGVLKLLHPFIPFVTEELWQSFSDSETIMLESWPVYDEKLNFPTEQADFTKVVELIQSIRAQRAELNVPPSKKVSLIIETEEPQIFYDSIPFLERLAGISEVKIQSKVEQLDGYVTVVTPVARGFMPFGELVDKEKEKARLEKERIAAEKEVEFLASKLNNQGFLAKAPQQQIELQRQKLATAKEKLEKILVSIQAFE